MKQLRKNARAIQKIFLIGIGRMLKVFAMSCEMTYEDFYYDLAEELDITDEQVKHYARDGLPFPDQHTHEVPITQKQLHNAINNIFEPKAVKKLGDDEKLIRAYSQLNEYLFSFIDDCYSCIKKWEDCMPFLTDDFEKYLISHLVYREAWPWDKPPSSQNLKLLKESLEKYSIKRIGREPQPNISVADLYTLLSCIEYIKRIRS